MQATVIHEMSGLRVTSFGNGLAYELMNTDTSRAVFFQGDDAETFRRELEALYGRRRPQLSFANALACIWFDYADQAEPVASIR